LALPFGYLVGHVAGCVATHGFRHHHLDSLAVEHSALPALSQVAFPLLVLSLGAAALMGARGDRWALSTRSLAGMLGGSFVVVELWEHMGFGQSVTAGLTDRVLWVGLAVQVLVAFALGRLLRRAHVAGVRFRSAVALPPVTGAARLWQPHAERPRTTVVTGAVCERGPPAVARS
jgi:hypothetical protein